MWSCDCKTRVFKLFDAFEAKKLTFFKKRNIGMYDEIDYLGFSKMLFHNSPKSKKVGCKLYQYRFQIKLEQKTDF